MRKYPQPSDYQAAIQNPHLVLREPDLAAAAVRLDRLGLPVVSSGGFALSFYLQTPRGEEWVVRCFKADSPDRRARYDAISRFLNAHPDPLLLDVDYYEQGILVNGAWYPIVKMPLVRGVTLQRHIEAEIGSGRSVAQLSASFRTLVNRLEELGIAHGDLQHGNIMVQNGALVLVDYDGMYVPALHGWPAAERGSGAYQHPLRQNQFSPELDRFSAIVIDISLQALTYAPGLWAKYHTGENLLFCARDFTAPQTAPLLRDLLDIPHLRPAVQSLRAICGSPFDAVPLLDTVVPPLPLDAGPLYLPRVTQPVRSPLAGQTGAVDDLDAQLTRLYTNWTPPPPAGSAAPILAAQPTPPGSAGGSVQPAPPGAHAPGSPAKTPPASRALSKLERIDTVVRRIRLIFILVVSVPTFVAAYFRETSGPPAVPQARTAFVTPYKEPDGLYLSYAPIKLKSLVPACPARLAVEQLSPEGLVEQNLVEFRWRSDTILADECSFRLELWQVGKPPLTLENGNRVRREGNMYRMAVYLPNLLPPEQRVPGRFYWTIRVDDLGTFGGARWFDWTPQ
jgi:hypothetical protein